MNLPGRSDFIDVHNHGASEIPGVYIIENLMAHEERIPSASGSMAFTYGIHPWFLNNDNSKHQITNVMANMSNPHVIALGEAGFDRIKGPGPELQRKVFEEQVTISEQHGKPVIIHCVRAWEELLMMHKRIRPELPWLVHGFRGNKELALQLINKGMYLSFWFDFILRPESTSMVKSLPVERIFLETDGSGADIKVIYNKVSADLGLPVEELKDQIVKNFYIFFNFKTVSS